MIDRLLLSLRLTHLRLLTRWHRLRWRLERRRRTRQIAAMRAQLDAASAANRAVMAELQAAMARLDDQAN